MTEHPQPPTKSIVIQESGLIVFFDGSCPLCSKEIRHYRKLKALQPVCWIDISSDQALLKQRGIDLEDAMRELHVISHEGNTVTGAAAFMHIWQQLPGYRYLNQLIAILRLQPLLGWAYKHFANWRYQRRRQGRCNG